MQNLETQERLKFNTIVQQATHNPEFSLAILLVLAQHCIGHNKEEILKLLKTYTADVPISIYWMGTDNKFIGSNKYNIAAMGLGSENDYIGKTPYDFYTHEVADKIMRHNNEVIRTRKVLSQEEIINDINTGQVKYLSMLKVPLLDKEEVIGLVAATVDITKEKEIKKLYIENEKQRIQAAEQERYIKAAAKFLHDVRTPLMSLGVIIRSCNKELPESVRLALLEATRNVESIAHSLLSGYEDKTIRASLLKEEPRQPILVSLALLYLLIEKRYQYKNLPVRFEHEFSSNSNFSFIKVDSTAFKRILSNILNSMVNGFGGKEGEIIVKLMVDDIQLKIIIQDNGNGISDQMVYKIKNNVAIAEDNKDSFNLNFSEIKEMLKNNNGEFGIESELNKGTKLTLVFPIVSAPEWVASEIPLRRGDKVVILDDDSSIHNVWKMKFKDYAGIVELKHFMIGEEALNFINTMDKSRMLLLTDYELIKPELDGLLVIKKAQVPRSFLVTSHFDNQIVIDLANKSHTKVLPKQLTSEVLIKVVS